MEIKEIYNCFSHSSGICTDTRKLKKDCIFFALKGKNFNGNEYAHNALKLGAKFVVIDQAEYKQDENYILVDNVLGTLQNLAKYHRQKMKFPVIGITGTNGKTTTKELINAALSSQFKTTYTQGNFNNEIGVPLTILSTDLDTEMLIVEMGANHVNEIEFLCNISQIDFGLITNIGKAHLEGFGSYENIIKTKNELYEYLYSKNNIVFVNGDDELLMNLSKKMNRILYHDYSEIQNTSSFLSISVEDIIINSQLIGSYNATNIIAAYSIGRYFGINSNKLADALSNYKPSNNRSELKKTELKNLLILDAYNANPSSMELAISSLIKNKKNNPYFILGDMLELGQNSLKEHQSIINLLEVNNTINVLLVGPEFGNSKHSFIHFKQTNDLKEYLKQNPIKNSTILLKGSRGMKLEELESVL